mmetsp:Transcript_41543/g.117647  ORF Transcript_41543/g.117647 Transcript_41543/m.117647 type:complete len:245 (-) Transcript_41543:51-785(-)
MAWAWCCCEGAEVAAYVSVDARPTLGAIDDEAPPAAGRPRRASRQNRAASRTDAPFVAILVKLQPDEPLGLRMELFDPQRICICSVSSSGETPVEAYNVRARRGRAIHLGDLVVSVNGERSSSEEMLKAIRETQTVRMEVLHPLSLPRSICKRGAPLGLALKYDEATGTFLYVAGVHGGAVERDGVDIRVGDRIHRVNGTQGRPNTLLRALGQADTLELEIWRPPDAVSKSPPGSACEGEPSSS